MANTFNDPQELLMGTALASDSTGDKLTIPVQFKCEVYRFWVMITGSSSHATAAKWAFDRRITAGSDTGRVDDVATLSKTASVNQQGKELVNYPTTRVTLLPGQEIIVEVDTANGEACTFSAGVSVIRSPEADGNLTNIKKVTS